MKEVTEGLFRQNTNSIIIKNNTKNDTQAQGGRERVGTAGEGRSPGARGAPLRTQSAEAARRAAGLRPVPGFFVDLRRRI